MPSSDPAIRAALMEHVKKIGVPPSVLDIGMGYGEYGALFKNIHPWIRVIGLEIFPGYIKKDWGHSNLYNEVHIGDMRTFNYSLVGAHLVLACDVIEHVVKDEGIEVIQELKRHFDWILVTVPIVDYPQGPENEFNNPHEEHKHQWKRDEVEKDLGMKFICEAGVCGLFEWRKPC